MLIIPVFVPHVGCPHDCCFCNQRIISGSAAAPSIDDVKRTVQSYVDIMPNYDTVQIAFFGGSFTGIPTEDQKRYLEAARPYIENGLVDSIRISTRPDCINESILDMLSAYGVRTIELGAQSMNDDVLRRSGRGHSAEDTVNASRLIRKAGFELGLQTMTGLPGASFDDDLRTADRIISLSPDIVRIYPTIVIKGTHLHTMYERGEYKAPSLDETVLLCAGLSVKYSSAGIKVIRMGLQSSDNIADDGEIAAGPYHPAFGQLVRSKLAYDKLIEIGKAEDGVYTAYVPAAELSDYIGQKKCNVNMLKAQFGYKKVYIRPIV